MVNGELWDNLVDKATTSHGITPYVGPPCTEGVCLNGGICVPKLNEFTCRCPMDFIGLRCEKSMAEEDRDRPVSFNGRTFFSFPNRITRRLRGQRENSFRIKFRTVEKHGLLLWLNKGATTHGDYLALAVGNGLLEFSFNLGKQRHLLIIRSLIRVDDGLWHTADIIRKKTLGTLQ
ncbi:agrin-like isoform X2 [Tachypleus tridentatus]|uniref:agrin-like isoform X2 n=1 Tax=Tachypleus tridentatus TaxID=6853 RepID=UPI003FD29E02